MNSEKSKIRKVGIKKKIENQKSRKSEEKNWEIKKVENQKKQEIRKGDFEKNQLTKGLTKKIKINQVMVGTSGLVL